MATWTNTYFPFLPTSVLFLTTQGGSLTVAADGSAPGVVTFSTPFGSVITSVNVTASSITVPGSYALSAEVVQGTPALSGFSVYVAGGPPGSMCTVYWTANGV